MKKITVGLKKNSYPIFIGKSVLQKLSSQVKLYTKDGFVTIISNRNIAKLYQKKINSILNAFRVHWILIPDGEKYKNLSTVEKIYHQLIKLGLHRQSLLIGLGGGVVGDITGFVAATYLRGIPFLQVPTTLLAQVDSSVGGKTGVDLPMGKNLVGSFYQPKAVIIDTLFINSLPLREYRCGLSEVIKYGLIADAKLFAYLNKNDQDVLNKKTAALSHIITRSCQIKASIVAKDEKEAGLRAILNFGHTLGHAIEQITGFHKIKHGEAVSIGMLFATQLSYHHGLLPKTAPLLLEELLKKYGLPRKIPALSKKRLRQTLVKDKKSTGAIIKFILLKRLGQAVIYPLTPDAIVKYIP